MGCSLPGRVLRAGRTWCSSAVMWALGWVLQTQGPWAVLGQKFTKGKGFGLFQIARKDKTWPGDEPGHCWWRRLHVQGSQHSSVCRGLWLSQSHSMLWVGRALKAKPVPPTPAVGRDISTRPGCSRPLWGFGCAWQKMVNFVLPSGKDAQVTWAAQLSGDAVESGTEQKTPVLRWIRRPL